MKPLRSTCRPLSVFPETLLDPGSSHDPCEYVTGLLQRVFYSHHRIHKYGCLLQLSDILCWGRITFTCCSDLIGQTHFQSPRHITSNVHCSYFISGLILTKCNDANVANELISDGQVLSRIYLVVSFYSYLYMLSVSIHFYSIYPYLHCPLSTSLVSTHIRTAKVNQSKSPFMAASLNLNPSEEQRDSL